MSETHPSAERETTTVASVLATAGGAVVVAWLVPQLQELLGYLVILFAIGTAALMVVPGLREVFYTATAFGVWLLSYTTYFVVIEGYGGDFVWIFVAGGVLAIALDLYRRAFQRNSQTG